MFYLEVIKDLLAKGAVVECLDLKEAPDILSQVLSEEELAGFVTKVVDISNSLQVKAGLGFRVAVFGAPRSFRMRS